MTLSVEREGNRFRVKWQGNSLDWFPDTATNRKAVLVFLRYFRAERGRRYTVSEPFRKNEKTRCHRFELSSCEIEGKIAAGGISWHTQSDHRTRSFGLCWRG